MTMANNVTNKLTIIGDNATVQEFVKRAAGTGVEYPPSIMERRAGFPTGPASVVPLTFHNFVPVPSLLAARTYAAEDEQREAAGRMFPLTTAGGCISGYHWQLANWGTKWDAYAHKPTLTGDGWATFEFETAWNPPRLFIWTVSGEYPTCRFLYSWQDEYKDGPAGRETVIAGRLTAISNNRNPIATHDAWIQSVMDDA